MLAKIMNFGGRQPLRLRQTAQRVSSGAIDLSVFRKVCRRFRQVGRHHGDELRFRHWLQCIVEFSLLANCR